MQKHSIRKQCLLSRRRLTKAEVEKFSEIITNSTIDILKDIKPKTVHIYISINAEPKTNKIISWLQNNVDDIYVPVLNGDEMYCMPFMDINTKPSNNVILRSNITHCNHKVIDLAIVPTLAFDYKLNRIGYGGGYYDKFFNSHKVATKIGLCYETNRYEAIPAEQHDEPMNYIITEAGIYS